MSTSVCSRLGQSGEDLLRHLREHLAPLAVVAIVLHVVGAHELLAVEGDGYPAVPGVGRVVLQLDEETGLDKQGDQLIDPGCVVVPPPSVHIAAECKRQGGLALLAGVELVVDIVRYVGARHVWFVQRFHHPAVCRRIRLRPGRRCRQADVSLVQLGGRQEDKDVDQ